MKLVWTTCSELQDTLEYSYEYEKAIVFTNEVLVRNYKLRLNIRINTKRPSYVHEQAEWIFPENLDMKRCLLGFVCRQKLTSYLYRKLA